MVQGFKAFIARGNVLDLAVAVIIGAAFGSIVKSLTDDVLMPLIGMVLGGLDFSGYFIRLGPVPEGYRGSLTNYAALKAAGVPLLGYGQFITAVVNFLILAFIIYQIVRLAAKAMPMKEVVQTGPKEEILLLREMRDHLKKVAETSAHQPDLTHGAEDMHVPLERASGRP